MWYIGSFPCVCCTRRRASSVCAFKKEREGDGRAGGRPARKVMGANGAGDKEGLVEIQNQVEGAVSSSTTQQKPCDKKQKYKNSGRSSDT